MNGDLVIWISMKLVFQSTNQQINKSTQDLYGPIDKLLAMHLQQVRGL